MPRSPRVDYIGATHHVFFRGNARGDVALDATDYRRALSLIEQMTARFELVCHAWCLLPNHGHLVLTSQLGNLSRAMHWLGTTSAHAFNRRYERSGHVFQGRFGSRLVEDDEHFLELARYLPLNPVRAGFCKSPGEWSWSSYAATAGHRTGPWFLDGGAIIGMLGSTEAYVSWVEGGVDSTILDEHGFRQPPERPPLSEILSFSSDSAIAFAQSAGYAQSEIAVHLGVSRSQICRRLARHAEGQARNLRA